MDDRSPAVMSSNKSSTEGAAGFTYILEPETPSSKNALRARSKAFSFRVRAETARAEAMPKFSLYLRPSRSINMSPGDSTTPANQEPIMTCDAPAASANATSRGYLMPPSAQTCLPWLAAAWAHSWTAENCGRPTAVIIRVVHIAPGPTPTFRISAPASIRSCAPSADTTLPATIGTRSEEHTSELQSRGQLV